MSSVSSSWWKEVQPHFGQMWGSSSALWPFSTLGWPERTEDLKYFYPTNTLVTGYDIIFFWVARMIFSAVEHTGTVPFNTVLIHGLVRDEQGRKMSKSLGNGIDPLEVIDEYGADALRYMLASGNSPGNDLRYSEDKVKAARNFANKLWNATRFILMNLSDEITRPELPAVLTLEDKWVLSKYNNLCLLYTSLFKPIFAFCTEDAASSLRKKGWLIKWPLQ